MTDTQGLLLCAKYATPPNHFGYCGPRENPSLVDHLKESVADPEVAAIISEFEVLYPYLQLIAKVNHIDDPFRRDVVESYWLGNHLLDNVSARDTYALLQEKLSLEKVVETGQLQRFKHKVFTLHYLPHHTFHVFNIFKRIGKTMGVYSLDTMDACRIGWGNVIQVLPSDKTPAQRVIVKAQTVIMKGRHIALSAPAVREIRNGYNGKGHLRNISTGDWVSFHWGFACDILGSTQVRCLSHYTGQAIMYYNSPYL